MNPKPIAGAIAGFLLTTALGWQLAGDAPPNPPSASQDAERTASRESNRQPRHRGIYERTDDAAARMRAIRSASTPQERMRATIELANSLPVAELANWLEGRWFDECGSFDLTLFNKIARERWMTEDPEGLALWSIRNGGGAAQSILADWAKNDPQRVLAFFKEHPNPQMELQSLQQIAASQPALALGRLQEMIAAGLGTNNISGHYARQALLALAKNNPAALEAALDSLPAQWRSLAEGAVISQKLKTSFETEIAKLYERPDGLKIFQEIGGRSEIGGKLLGELANLPDSWKSAIGSNYYRFMNPSNAEQWLNADLEGSGFTAEQAKRIRAGALQYTAWNNPETTLKRIGEVELSEDERKSLIRETFRNNRRDSEKTASLLALLTSEEDRKIALGALPADSGGTAPAKAEQPSDWLAQAGSFDLGSKDSYQFISQLQSWDKTKIADLTSQFRDMPDEQKRNTALLLTRNGYTVDPALSGEAIRYLAANPGTAQQGQNSGDNSIRLASSHAVQWAQTDPIAASAWVNTLPSGDAKLWAQKNLAANWAKYDPDAAQQWVNSLPGAARSEVRDFMEKGATH